MTATSGLSCSTPFAYYDPATCSVRTSQGTFPWASTECSPILPRSGSMRSGELFGRPMLAAAIDVTDSGSWLPTPITSDSNGPGPTERDQQLRKIATLLPTPRTSDTNGPGAHGQGGMDLRTTVALLPTPVAQPSGNTPERHLEKKNRQGGPVTDLAIIIENGLVPTGGRLPTPMPSHDTPSSSDDQHPNPPTTGDSLPGSWNG
jgi:hypothetical protein